MLLEDFLSRLEGVKPNGSGYMARCPAHEDSTASLQVSEREDQSIGAFCHAGCPTEAVVVSMGLKLADLFGPEEDVIYTYQDERKVPLYDVVRKPGKQFLQRRYVGDSWEWGIEGTRRVIYRLPDILAADSGRIVFIVEGEKDADAVWEAGGIATCNVGGAGKWLPEYSDVLVGRHVRIIADQDEAGRKHANEVLLSLKRKAKSVRVVEPLAGKDVSNHLAAGHTLEDFTQLRSHYRPLDLSAEPPVVAWIVEDMIARGDLLLVSSPPKIGKSWWHMALTKVVVDGEPFFLNHAVLSHGRVLCIDEENPQDVVHWRFRKLGLQNHSNLRYIWNNGIRIDQNPERLRQEVFDFEPVLVIVDSLTRVHSKDENSVAEMGGFLNDMVKPLARDTGAAVVLIHHHDKAGHGPRGSGDIFASVDGSIDFYKAGDGSRFVQKLTGSRRVVTGEKMMVEILDVPGGITKLEGRILDG